MVTSLITKVILLRRSVSIPGYLLGVRGTKGFSLTDLKDVYYYIAVNVDSMRHLYMRQTYGTKHSRIDQAKFVEGSL